MLTDTLTFCILGFIRGRCLFVTPATIRPVFDRITFLSEPRPTTLTICTNGEEITGDMRGQGCVRKCVHSQNEPTRDVDPHPPL